MKNILRILSAIAITFAFAGCGEDEKENKEPEPVVVSVSSVSLDKSTISMIEGETANLAATVKPDNATNKAVEWKSSATSVATVDGSGKVTAMKAGEATVTVTTKDGGKTATCKVTVKAKEIAATGLSLDPSSISFVEGQTKSIKATVTPSNSTDEVVWPGTGTYLTSNGGGSYTAKKLDPNYVGFDLEVKAGSVTAKAAIMVYPMWFVNPLSGRITDDGGTTEITKGDMFTFYFSKKKSLNVTVDDYIGKSILPAEDFSVSSSNNGVATVSKTTIGGGEYNGFAIKGVAVGTATITVTIGSVSRTLKVTVKEKNIPATGLKVEPSSISFVEGQTKSLKATVTPSNSTDEVIWPISGTLANFRGIM
ncbi:MAG: Ig-like domain-containing protein [Bacteroidales bacterium]|nr:Ig-like domain-containing protein [Bacteroidales bacterium]MDY6002246.1 Ig-like domain-containing protein [Candidatus Cryptobacteroides sp.]